MDIDESSPTEKAGENEQSKRQPRDETKKDAKNHVPPSNNNGVPQPGLSDVVIAASEIGFVWLLALLGDQFDKRGQESVGNAFHYLASVGFVLLIAHVVFKAWRRPAVIIPLVLVACSGLAYLFFHPSPPPKQPRFLLGLVTSHTTNNVLNIDSALVPSNENAAWVPDTNPTVAIPLSSEETNVSLYFRIGNDPMPAVDIEAMVVEVDLPRAARFKMGKGWTEFVEWPTNKTSTPLIDSNFRHFESSSTRLLLSRQCESLPEITFDTTGRSDPKDLRNSRFPVLLAIYAKNMSPVRLGFWLAFMNIAPDLAGHTEPQIADAIPLSNGMWRVGIRAHN